MPPTSDPAPSRQCALCGARVGLDSPCCGVNADGTPAAPDWKGIAERVHGFDPDDTDRWDNRRKR